MTVPVPVPGVTMSGRVGVRLRQTRALAPGLVRAVPWGPLLASAALGLAMVQLGSPGSLLLRLHLAAVLLCAGAAYVVDDPTGATLASSPTPLLTRRVLRVALAVAVTGAAWIVLLLDARWASAAGQWPPGSLTLKAAALLATGLTTAVLAARVAPDGRGGVAGSAAVLVLSLVSVVLPARWSPLPIAEEAFHRPAALLTLGLVAFVLASPDPGRPPIPTTPRP